LQGQKTYGGSKNDYVHSIQKTSDGGYIMIGENSSLGAGGSDLWVLKLDAIGAIANCSAIGSAWATTKTTRVTVTNTTLTGINANFTIESATVSINVTNAFLTEACPVEENDPAIIYTGTWTSRSFPSCSGTALKYSCETGAKAEFSFNGTGLKWIVTKASMAGKAKACLDGSTMCKVVDLYSATPQFQSVLQKTGLTKGPHTVTIEVLGEKNPNSSNYCVDIDAFHIIP
jgi:hypothetical protein